MNTSQIYKFLYLEALHDYMTDAILTKDFLPKVHASIDEDMNITLNLRDITSITNV
jgi:hypothetical protein